jgi:8-oxo-dGTP pyrophosphatase MutT (NUDIX family)
MVQRYVLPGGRERLNRTASVQHSELIEPFSAQDVRQRALARLAAALHHDLMEAPIGAGDHLTSPHAFPNGLHPKRPAAVLVPVIAREDGATVLLTKRSEGLPQHSGQIAFPGGKIDPCDTSPIACALREAHEEIGLHTRHIEPVGYLDTYATGTGFRIFPVVAIVTPPFELTLNEGEVDDVFEVPMRFLMDPANHERHTREAHNGATRHFHAMPYGERFIWGATAGMLKNLYERLYCD